MPAARAESGKSDAAQLREAILAKLTYSLGKDHVHAGPYDWFMATALAIRDRVIDRWMHSTRQTYAEQKKRVYYLSVEFLLGRLLFDTLGNLGITETAREALAELGVDIEDLRAIEPDQALGNGGLGRLAACFMDSMASLALPAYRLWHPLRPRLVQAAHQRRLAARSAGGLAGLPQSLGIRASGSDLSDRLRRRGGIYRRRR